MSEAHSTGTSQGPYAVGASAYWAAGWKGCLPLPAGSKGPVPKGYTGNAGAWPSYPDVMAWAEDRGAGNIALRLPPSVLGIDVDHYDGKPGGGVLWLLEQQLGELPPTWRTTSRDDGTSGIRLYRVPVGLRWPGVLGHGIETIRYEHRYAVVWPSAHPNGGTYRWITPEGVTSLGSVPTVDELPELPASWVQHFTGGELATDQARADLGGAEVHAWIAERGAGPACRHMHNALAAGLLELTAGGARHDAALALTNRLTWLIGEGHRGGSAALTQACQAFLEAAAGARPGLVGEWARMLEGAVKLAAAAHPDPNEDPCDNPFTGLLMPAQATTPAATVTTSTPASAPAPAAPSSPAVTAAPAELSDDELDNLTELQLRRNQAAAAEVERLRAQRTAMRQLELEDEELTIGDRVRRRLLDDRALLEYKRVTEPPADEFDDGLIGDILARPADPPMRCEGLIPWNASTLLVAQRKTGKTTMLLNLARCLITGEPFLGEFPVIALEEGERVAFLNYEVSAAQLARWAHEAGIPLDRLYLVNLRGRRNPLGHPEDRAKLVGRMRAHNVKAVIVDPFGRAYTGVSQNDNGEVQSFLVDLDMFVRAEVGALDLFLATHAGWDGERTRGASALEDWGDVIITLTRDPEDESRRYMRAMGRDVEVDEDEISMGADRVMVRTGNGSRKTQKTDRKTATLAVLVVRAARSVPGLSYNQAETIIRGYDDAPTFQKGDVAKAAEWAKGQGLLTVTKGGPRGAASMTAINPEDAPAPRPPQTSPDLPVGKSLTSPAPLYRELGGQQGAGGESSPTWSSLNKTTGEAPE